MADGKRADEDRRRADEQRTRMHQRLDELREDTEERFRHMEESIVIAGQTAAQARGEVQALHRVVVDEVKPQTDEFKRIRLMGSGFMLAVAMVAGTLGITFADVVKTFVAGLKQALVGH